MNLRTDPAGLSATRPAGAALGREAVPEHDARALTGPGGIARIRLDGQDYTLRITRAGKLILTK
jgi:hemin uptake protein HemP